MRHLFGCPDIVSLTEKFLMARNFFRIFTENNPIMGYSKTFFIPEAKGLTRIPFFESFAGSHVNTPHVAVTFVGWRVYTQVFLRVRGNTLQLPPDKRLCRQWMSSLFCGFLPNPLSMTYSVDGFISIVFDVSPECGLFDRVWAKFLKCQWMRYLFGCPDIVSLTVEFVMARDFFRIFTENNPARGTGKNIICPTWTG